MDWRKNEEISIIAILGDTAGEIGLPLEASLLTYFEFGDLLQMWISHVVHTARS